MYIKFSPPLKYISWISPDFIFLCGKCVGLNDNIDLSALLTLGSGRVRVSLATWSPILQLRILLSVLIFFCNSKREIG